MKAFLNRILEDSYNFNKLDSVLNLKLIDVKEKFENNEKLDNLVYHYKELTTVKDFLLNDDLCKIHKSCKILSFLLSYSTLTHDKDTKDNNKDYCDKEWERFLEELTNTLLKSINNNTENNLINDHLFTLLHHLTLYLTNELSELKSTTDQQLKVDKSKKPLINNIYNNVIKINNNKLNKTTVSLLKYYYKTNQLQLNSLEKDNPYLYQLNRLSTLSDDKEVLNDIFYLLYNINKNNLPNYFNKPNNSNLKFVSYVLDQFILNKNAVETSEVNVYNLYESVTKSIKFYVLQLNSLEKDKQNVLLLFELLERLVKLLNSDLVLVHLYKLVQIFNLLFSSEPFLLNYSDYIYNLLKLINEHCYDFNSLINSNKLRSLLNLDSLGTNDQFNSNKQFNKDNQDYKDRKENEKEDRRDSLLKLYIYLTNNEDLEQLILKLVESNNSNTTTGSNVNKDMNGEVVVKNKQTTGNNTNTNSKLFLTLFNQYISNTLSTHNNNNQGLNYPLLVKMFNFIKTNGSVNVPLLYQIQVLLSDQNLVNLVNK